MPIAFCKGFFRCLFIYFTGCCQRCAYAWFCQCSDDLRGSAGVALMRGFGGVPVICRVLPALHLCVVPVAF